MADADLPCPYCNATGVQLGRSCTPCRGTGRVVLPPVVEEPHERAWRIPTGDGSDYGVLVEIPCTTPPNRSHWWLLCPASATLYVPGRDGSLDLTDCSIGQECDYLDDTHAKAHVLVQRLTSGDVTPLLSGGGDG